MIRLGGFKGAALSTTASPLGFSASSLERRWLSETIHRLHVSRNLLLATSGSNGHRNVHTHGKAGFVSSASPDQGHSRQNNMAMANTIKLNDGLHGNSASLLRKLHTPLNTRSRSFSSSTSRRVPDSFFARNHFGFISVPHQMAYVVERFGRFHRVLTPGLHFLIPLVDRLAYIHSLKEEALTIPNQTAITRDNVTLQIDGVLYVQIKDAYKASYGVENPIFAVTQLAQTTMRSELGKLTLDNTFLERNALNKTIVEAINTAAGPWGLTCLRYEIRDILLPANIRSAMERQAEAERLKRAEVLRSEGERARLVNIALGQKEATILNAEGQAEAVRQRAAAAAESVRKIADTTSIPGGMQALSLQLAENYVAAFGRLAEGSNTLIVPADAANPSRLLGQALGVFRAVDRSLAEAPPTSPPSPNPPAASN